MTSIFDQIRQAKLMLDASDHAHYYNPRQAGKSHMAGMIFDAIAPPPREPVGRLFGMDVIVSDHCYQVRPVRVPRTNNARIQKKWLKRYGTERVPVVYVMGNGMMVMPPERFQQMKEEVKRSSAMVILDDIDGSKRHG